jgi:hypothetical protein
MKEHSLNSLNNFIGGWYINENVCDGIIEIFNNDLEKKDGHYINENNIHTVDRTIKHSIDSQLPKPGLYKEIDFYLDQLFGALHFYIGKYPECNSIDPLTITEVPNIQYYPPGGAYFKYHSERGGLDPISSRRHLVFMTYLNDVNDGGETEFLYQNIKVKPQKGLTLFWPSDWTHTHKGNPSVTEEKYIITGWLSFSEIV